MATKNLVPRSDNEGKLGTGAKRWAAVNAAKLYGKLQIQELSTTTETEPTDLLLIYDQSNSEPRGISVNNLNLGSGIGVIDVRSNEFALDDSNTGSSFGSIFGMYKTVDFPNTEKGSIWYDFSFPTTWNTGADVNIELVYSMNGSDPDKIVKVDTDAWFVSTGDQPDTAAPDTSNSDNISTTSDNIGKYSELLMSNGSIAASDIPSGVSSIVLKISRDVGSDTYTGTFQLLGIRLYQ